MVMNMKALISSNEPVQTGYRVAQVAPDADIFAVADTLFWVACADDVVADQFWYDPQDQTIKAIPQLEVQQQQQPISEGAQTL
jgi:hypothetical protein